MEKLKASMLKIVLRSDIEYCKVGNVFYARNAFLVNSILSWYLKERNEQELDAHHIASFLKLLERHVKKEVILSWENEKGGLKVSAALHPEEELEILAEEV